MRNKATLYKTIDRLKFEYNLKTPIDTVEFAQKLGNIDIEYYDSKSEKLCGALYKDTISSILLNKRRAKPQHNFDCGHELIHYFFHESEDGLFNCIDNKYISQNSFIEWEANEGSAQLLVPYQEFIPLYVELCKSGLCFLDISIELYKHFGVTSSVIDIRLESLNYELYQYLNGVDIFDLNILSRRQQDIRGITYENPINSRCPYCSTKFDYTNYCPICGHFFAKFDPLNKGVPMKYKEIIINENNICGNKIIPLVLKNYCSLNCSDIFDNDKEATLLSNNARYCPDCGKPSSFNKAGYFKSWQTEKAEYEKNRRKNDPDKLPF
jgi:Zn-dependent peptidase ImmA (M78 family)